MDLKLITVDQIGLSARSTNALRRGGIMNVDKLLGQTEESLRNIRNLGSKSVEEILKKVEEYRKLRTSQELHHAVSTVREAGPRNSEAADELALRLDEKNATIDDLPLLSAKSANILRMNALIRLSSVAFLTESELLDLPYMDAGSAQEIVRLCSSYLSQSVQDTPSGERSPIDAETFKRMLLLPEVRDAIAQYAKRNDLPIDALGLSTRACNQLHRQGFTHLSEILFLSSDQLAGMPAMGTLSVQNILERRNVWLAQHRGALSAILSGEEEQLPHPEDDAVTAVILGLYRSARNAGLSLQDFRQRLPENVETEQLKRCVGQLLARGELEYVDFRCYRVYPRFADVMEECPKLTEKHRSILRRRLQGETLDSIGRDLNMTRERIRQLSIKSVENVRNWQLRKQINEILYANKANSDNKRPDPATGLKSFLFDEDYYRYFYGTYEFDGEAAEQWFGISQASLRYLSVVIKSRGTEPLDNALEDRNLDTGLRQRIRNYLNRDKLFLDGQWIPKKRGELERYYIEHFCMQDVSFQEFRTRFNAFLREQGIPYDEKIYETDETANSRKNHLSDARFLLWKYGEKFRAYDIEGRDYAALFSELGFDALENIELSTQKLVADHPEILARYDIRDQYELHNLLRKVLPEGSFHDFSIKRTPNICFGSFDRDAAILDLMISHAPISQADLAELIHDEYGYDVATVIGTYLTTLSDYYHQGVYRVEPKTMPENRREALRDALDEDFYYLDDLKRLYLRTVSGADPEEINPFNLKQLGFNVYSRYVLRGYSSLNEYFYKLLMQKDLQDITELRRRFTYVQAFSITLNDLKHSMVIVEYEPNRIITFRKLAAAGVTRESIQEFCNAVWEYVEPDVYFSAASLRQAGFESELYDLGFSDWFYANLLLTDPRFSFGVIFKSIILKKGNDDVTCRSFETSLIREAGSIDVYDLLTLMEETYGCTVSDRLDLIYKVKDGEVYYDRYLDRLYDSEERYQRELDRSEEL